MEHRAEGELMTNAETAPRSRTRTVAGAFGTVLKELVIVVVGALIVSSLLRASAVMRTRRRLAFAAPGLKIEVYLVADPAARYQWLATSVEQA